MYDHEKVSSDFARFLLSFSYTDNASGKADDLSLTLEDREQIWANDWVPQKGDSISATLTAKNFVGNGNKESIDCGYFEVDEMEYSSPPNTVSIKGVSAAISTALRGEENTRAWEAITLQAIAQELAAAAEMEISYLAEYNPYYKRRDQTEQSDLAFLLDCCSKAGLALKVTNDTIVIFDEEDMEAQEPIVILTKGQSNILRTRFKSKSRDIYRACEIKYKDPSTGQTIRHIYEPPNAPETGQLLKINEQVEDAEEGKVLARKRLREKNLKENMASITVVGDPKLVAGAVIKVNGYGCFDGKYYIETAKHSYSTSGYTVDIDCHKTMQSYFVNVAATIVTNRKARKRKQTKTRRLKWYEQ